MSALSMARPMNVEQIARAAQDFEYSDFIPLHSWLRTADALLTEASIYAREGNEQQTYLLLLRHAQLVLGCLSRHPDARHPSYRYRLSEAKQIVNENLTVLERLKPRIARKYERYLAAIRARDEWRFELDARNIEKRMVGDWQGRRSSVDGLEVSPANDFSPYGTGKTLTAGDNRDLAVRLARSEMSRRAAAKNRSGGNFRRDQTFNKVRGLRERSAEGDSDDESLKDLSQQIVATRQKMDRDQLGSRTFTSDGRTFTSTSYHYPNVPSRSELDYGMQATVPGASKTIPAKASIAPLLPPKETFERERRRRSLERTRSSPSPPTAYRMHERTASRDLAMREGAASPTPSLNAPDYIFKPSAYLENGTPLRSIFLPTSLRSQFLACAASNTRRNLETCGILVGTIISNALFISKVLVPQQDSTTDTCEVTDDIRYFEYCEREELLVFGWIHTHPSQSCFMSSRDLHTQFPYQLQLAESIAIVCAPSQEPSWGVFRLTDPPGIKTIRNCNKPGLFHPHDEDEIYTDALRPGHVFEAPGLQCEIVDLRTARG